MPLKKSVRDAYDIGKDAYESYCKDRLISRKSSIYDTIKMNKLPLFCQKNAVQTSKTKLQIVSLKADCQLFSSLFIASQSRDADLEEFFAQENHGYPVSLSEYGKLRKTYKSLFLDCIEKTLEAPILQSKTVDMIAIDGAAYVHLNPPRNSKTFREYCEVDNAGKIKKLVAGVQRADLVFDVYRSDSIKSETRDTIGSTFKVSVRDSTPIVHDFKKFLLHDNNKAELFSRIADAISQCLTDIPTVVLSPKDEKVLSNTPVDLSSLEPCNHEEADTRIFVHVYDAARMGQQTVVVRTVDTDVVVIAIGLYFSLEVPNLWIDFGSGKNRRWLPIHTLAHFLGPEKCAALLFWYAFTGCDTVSSFCGVGKKTAWIVWLAFPEITDTFARLSSGSSQFSEEDWLKIQRFVVLLYDRSCPCTDVNSARRYLFTKKGRPIDNCPPTEDALRQHTYRAIYQSSVWRCSRERSIPTLDISNFGWSVKDDSASPVWMTVEEAAKSCQELVKCGCKKSCTNRCKCKRGGFKCTELCYCSGGCTNL